MTFQKFPLAFRAGQFVDNSADNLTLQCRDYDTYQYTTVTLTLGLWQQMTSLRLVPKVITVTMIRVIHPHHNANRRWRASVSTLLLSGTNINVIIQSSEIHILQQRFQFKKMQCSLQLFMDLNALLVQNLSQDDLAKNNFVQS